MKMSLAEVFYILRCPLCADQLSRLLKIIFFQLSVMKRRKVCSVETSETGSVLAYLLTHFVLQIMRTLQAVWVFCLKIPTRGSCKPPWLPVIDSCGAQDWFDCCCQLFLVSVGACFAISGHHAKVLRNPLALGVLPFTPFFVVAIFISFSLKRAVIFKHITWWHRLACKATSWIEVKWN